MLILFLTYVLLSTGWKSYKDNMGWRWVIVLILATASYIGIGVKSGAFKYMWDQLAAFVKSPPWSREAADESTWLIPEKDTPKHFSAQLEASGPDLWQNKQAKYHDNRTPSL